MKRKSHASSIHNMYAIAARQSMIYDPAMVTVKGLNRGSLSGRF